MEENKNVSAEEAKAIEKALDEQVGIKIDPKAQTTANIIKFLVMAVFGVCIFFIQFPIGGKMQIPMVWLSNTVKGFLKPYFTYIVDAICLFLAVTFTIGKIKKDSWCGKFMAKDGIINGVLYYVALAVCVMVTLNIGPAQFLDPEVGPEAVYLAGACMCTITIAGWLVNLLTEFGMLEFIGTLITPLMRRLFLLPGQSAIDAVSSFVAAPAAGVFITNKLYNGKVYTEKEAACIMTNFSVVSLGLQALIAGIVGHDEYYGRMIIFSLLIVFVMAIIVIRIPPLSKRPNTYVDGSVQSEEMRKPGKYTKDTVPNAFKAAVTQASKGKISILVTALPDLLSFVVKIIGFIAGLAAVVLWLGYYTPLFDWIGKIMIPYLKLCQVPDAAVVAPSTLIGCTEVLLPALLVEAPAAAGTLAECSIFFVCLLSTVQIIFFDESANAMMASDVPFSALQLFVIFLIRTLIAIPICSLVAHILFPL